MQFCKIRWKISRSSSPTLRLCVVCHHLVLILQGLQDEALLLIPIYESWLDLQLTEYLSVILKEKQQQLLSDQQLPL